MEDNVTTKSTKNEILDAYNAALKKVKQLEKEKPAQTHETEAKKETVGRAKEETPENIVTRLSGLKLETSAAFDKLEKSYLQEQYRLADLEKAIGIETAHLESLYNIKIELDSLAALLIAQKEKRKQLEEDFVNRKIGLDNEILETKSAWEKDRKFFELTKKEEQERVQKERKREEEDFQYTLQLNRKKDADIYTAEHNALVKEIEYKKETFELEIATRETKLAAAENELATLQNESKDFSTRLLLATEEAQTNTTKSLKREFEFEKQLLQKETEGVLNLKLQIIGTLEQRIKELENMVLQSQSKAVTAESSVKDIAMKAIESATKVTVFDKGNYGANMP